MKKNADYKNNPGYIAENAMWEFVESVVSLMDNKEISKSDLARQAKLAPAQVTRILSGDHNLTVRTMAKVASALEMDLNIAFKPRLSAISSHAFSLIQVFSDDAVDFEQEEAFEKQEEIAI